MANYHFAGNEFTGRRAGTEQPTLTDRVYGTLRDEIVTGTMRPGTRLVRRALGKRLGVSPMPVTEALMRLEMDGLVESRPLCGARVRPLTFEDLSSDQVLREAIECQAARVCAENASGEQFARLASQARTVDRLMQQGDPGSRLGMQAHLELHVAVADEGGFPRLAEELERLWFRRLMRLNWVKATHYKAVPDDWHQSLIRAIASRDLGLAEEAMRRHVSYGNEDDRAALEYVLQESGQRG